MQLCLHMPAEPCSSYTELVGYTTQPYSEQASQLSIQAQLSLNDIRPNECQAIFAIFHVQAPYLTCSAAAIATLLFPNRSLMQP